MKSHALLLPFCVLLAPVLLGVLHEAIAKHLAASLVLLAWIRSFTVRAIAAAGFALWV